MLAHRRARAFSLLEVLITMTVVGIVSTMVFVGLSRLMMLSMQDEVHQAVYNDILLSMEHVRRDVQLSTNVVTKAGYRSLGGSCLILRQPMVDAARNIIPNSFHYVCYTTSMKNGGAHDGLVREVWLKADAKAPVESRLINANIVLAGFAYDGLSVGGVESPADVRNVTITLASGRDTGLRAPGRGGLADAEADLASLRSKIASGVSVGDLRTGVDTLNRKRPDLTIALSTASAFLRNHKTMGVAAN